MDPLLSAELTNLSVQLGTILHHCLTHPELSAAAADIKRLVARGPIGLRRNYSKVQVTHSAECACKRRAHTLTYHVVRVRNFLNRHMRGFGDARIETALKMEIREANRVMASLQSQCCPKMAS